MNEAAARRERGHLSIGEVLNLLQGEFPDITISKIRFLESQGLIDPERTPSGYRKFYEADIGRLRWILVQQRENFLPLKVIKERLESGEADTVADGKGQVADGKGHAADGAVDEADNKAAPPAGSARADRAATTAELDLAPTPGPAKPAKAVPAAAAAPDVASIARGATPDSSAKSGSSAPPSSPTPSADGSAASARVANDDGDGDLSRGAARAARAAVRSAPLDPGLASVALSRDELAEAAGITPADVADLERFGLLTGRSIGPTVLYDEAALGVARLAAGFIRHGVEGRHLRMYKVAAEREASFFQQVVMPFLKQRHPGARQQAVETLGELAELGEGLRAAMLHNALRDYLGSP